MRTLAITGGIASGKSLFGQMLSRLGADVLDADEIVRATHRPGGEGAKAVERVLGREFLNGDGSTNRSKTGDLMFTDPTVKRSLEAILHPIARQKTLAWRDAPSRAPFKAALVPLLFESAWDADWDVTLTIESSPETRVARLAGRGLSRDAALARIAAQATSAERCAKAHIIIFNNAGPDMLERAASIIFTHMEQKT